MEQNKTKITLIAIVVVILVAGGLYYMNQPQTPANNSQNAGTQGGANNTQPSSTVFSGATKPMEVTGGPLGKEGKPIMTYPITAEKGKFNPAETTIAKGGKVQVSIIAVDADYSVSFATLGLQLPIKKGQVVVFGFDASDSKVGEYAFTSKDPQGGTMTGKLIVK